MASQPKTRPKSYTIKYEDWLKERLRDPKEAAEYLTGSLEDGDAGVFLLAVRDVVDVYGGLGAVARKTGLNRENLYKMLSKRGNPRIDSLQAVLGHLGFSLAIGVAAKPKARARKRRPAAKRRSAA